ncbi:aspartate aminotransferase [Longimonas halophila]|uniref:Aminotransferase n=1 Tax=Longimonas halophila TaxID=1469170 RepID=A0A2H3P374_9BACT|nr:pyridoxal phosphate-dependent aminotransferase [Longimonas halophila]PEN08732.1 aspartate aminotransferase [Longimonas halophila]
MQSISLAERTNALKQSDIRAVTQQVNAVDGINLGQGICDLPTPEPIRERTRQAVTDDQSIYSHYAGIAPLRQAILQKAQSYNDLPATDIDEVMVSVGSTGAFVTAAMALLEAGDEVILFEPFYGYHRNILELTGATIRYVPLSGPGDTLDTEALERAINENTKAVIVTTPVNPSGKVWARHELETLLDLMQQHDLVAITDEIYEYMLYDDHEHVSLASLPGAYERTITLSGFSKSYNVTGWRMGYAVAPPHLIEKMGLLNDLFYICAPRPLQHGLLAALEDLGDEYIAQMQSDYAARRQMLCETLEAIGFDVPWPEGAYYVLADFAPLQATHDGFENDKAACQTLVQDAHVASVTGRSFYQHPEDGRTKLRFCFAKELPILKQACTQLRTALA